MESGSVMVQAMGWVPVPVKAAAGLVKTTVGVAPVMGRVVRTAPVGSRTVKAVAPAV